jgi:hypothetical protein
MIAVIAAVFLNQEGSAAGGHHAEPPKQTGSAQPQQTLPQSTQQNTEPHAGSTEEQTDTEPQAPSDDEPVDPDVTLPPETDPIEIETRETIPQQADAEYERWLAAAAVICVSIEYPDFQLEGIYASSSTALADKFSSDGVSILFVSGGQRMAIHANALEGERTEPGTRDISTEVIGYASFDSVDPQRIDTASMDQIHPEELEDLIAQSLLVSIYNH